MKGCKDCANYRDYYGQDIGCKEHRQKTRNPYAGYGFDYLVGCRKCDTTVYSVDKEDSLCWRCAI